MEYIDVLNWVLDASFKAQSAVRYEMKKHMFKIELSSNKDATIRELISQLDYEGSLAGHAYIASGFKIDWHPVGRRETLVRYYMNSKITKRCQDKEEYIREDAQRFYEVYFVEMELRKMLSQPDEANSFGQDGEQHEREIKEDELRGYFKIVFLGAGNGNIDYFTNNLLPDLKENRSDKDFAKIALMIYNNGKLTSSMRPKTFKEWYKRFCDMVGCGFHRDYKPSILDAGNDFKQAFYYLQK